MKSKKEIKKSIIKPQQEKPSEKQKNVDYIFFTEHKTAIISLAIISFLAYANTIFHEFTIDDAIVITDNIFVKKGFNGLYDIFSKDTFYGFFGTEKDLVAGGRYRPLTLMLFSFISQFFGQNPFYFHLLNITIYSVLSVAIYFFIFRTHIVDNIKNKIFAFSCALLFALHPIHTEAVANVKGMDEVLCMLLGILSLIFIQQYIKSNKTIHIFIACSLLLSSILSKENGISFAFLIVIYYFIFNKNTASSWVKTAVFSGITTLIYIFIRWKIIGIKNNVESYEILNNPFAYASFSQHYGTVFHTWWLYIKLLIIPFPLSHDYYFNEIPYSEILSLYAILGIIIYLSILIIGIIFTFQKKSFGFFALFFISTFALVSNLIFPIGTTMGERFIFIPSFSFIVILVFFIFEKIPFQFSKYFVLIIALIYAFLTFQRNKAWKNNYTLFKTDIIQSPNSAKLNNAYGGETLAQHIKEENEETKNKMIDDAIEHLNKALQIHPKYTNAYLLLGNAYFYKKNYEKAIENYQNCLKIAPKYNDALLNMPKAAYELGSNYGKIKNDIPNAIKYFEIALQYSPNYREAMLDLGVAYGFSRQFDKAQKILEKANTMYPNDKNIMQNLITTYINNNQKEKAVQLELQYQKLP